jgi:uncharacterized protein YdcH (DUF465 family)
MKTNYLNNKDMLREIHRSKITYSSYLSQNDQDYDLIVHDFDNLDEKISQARQNKAVRHAQQAQEQQLKAGKKTKLEEHAVDPDSISISDLVFRLMTWQHVPENQVWIDQQAELEDTDVEEGDSEELVDPKVAKISKRHVRVNFPPFEHYRLNDDLTPHCVGRSHWQGDLETGKFSKDHGTMTRELATMFMKLCERYASRGNWRGYTYNEEMKGQALLHLVHIGLQFDESKSSNPFSYYTQSLTNSFTRVLNIEKRHQNIRDDILELNNYNPSYTRQGGWQYGDE